MRSSHPSFLATTDDELDREEEEQLNTTRRSNITSGKLRSADITSIKKVVWPHELVFTPKCQPTAYESLSAMAFVNGYLTIMPLQKDTLTDKMAAHLLEIPEDVETFVWPMVGAYLVVWHLEQSRATWNGEVMRLKLRRSLVWHRIASRTSPQPSATNSRLQLKPPVHWPLQ